MTRVLYNPYDWGLNLTERATAIGAELSGDPDWGAGISTRHEIDEGFRHSKILLTVFDILGNRTSLNTLEACTIGGDRYAIHITDDGRELLSDIEDYEWVLTKPVEETVKVAPKKIVKAINGEAVTLTPQMIELGKLLSEDPEWCEDAFPSWTIPGALFLPGSVHPTDPILVKVVELLGDFEHIKVCDVSSYFSVTGRVNTVFDDLVWKEGELTSGDGDWFKHAFLQHPLTSGEGK